MVRMQSRQNASDQATGYLLVQVQDTQPQRIVIGYVGRKPFPHRIQYLLVVVWCRDCVLPI